MRAGVVRASAVGVTVAVAGVWAGVVHAGHRPGSEVTAVRVDRTDEVGLFDGMAFERLVGHVEGRVHRSERVVGLAGVVGDAEFHSYRSEFEIIRPVDADRREVAVVEVENRGTPLMLQMLNQFVIGFSGPPSKNTYADGLGDGFLFDGGRSYARVQWETGKSSGVPSTAQGVGEVIVRDFGRLLRSGRIGEDDSRLGRYETLILTGISQSGWFIDTFVAEGFNAGPAGRRVYDGVLVLASGGNWLAINQLGDDGEPQRPYVRPDGRPLTASQILTRPRTDPFFVDIVTYTDFYRLRAALARDPGPPWRYRRYEVPASHVPAFFVDDTFVFETLGCNDKRVVPLSPLDYRPYVRAMLVGLEDQLHGSRRGLPPPMLFRLGPEPEASEHFNDLPDSEVRVPRVDHATQPQGGVRFPEVDLPLGRLEPPALKPATTSGATAICGNFSAYEPFHRGELQSRYGDVERYESRVLSRLDWLVRSGLLLEDDRRGVAQDLRHRFESAPS